MDGLWMRAGYTGGAATAEPSAPRMQPTAPLCARDVRAQALGIIAQLLGVEPNHLRLEAEIVDDLGADSLQFVELAVALEDVLRVEIRDDDIERIRTVGDALTCVEHAFERQVRRDPQSGSI